MPNITCLLVAVAFLLGLIRVSFGQQPSTTKESTAAKPTLEVTGDQTLDPKKEYGAIVIKASNITLDGQGAWLIGETKGTAKDFKGFAVLAEGVSNVTIKNLNAKGWETGLIARNASGLTIENCDFSDNFHDPDFGWGENGRRGGLLLERVTKSTIRKNKANRNWDGCVLMESKDNTLENNDFSHASNTCLKLWNSSRNVIQSNTLSHGIRIAPKEVHARDSTSVLVESGSNDNQFLANDCTHGGDGIFVRVLNGWCSTGNLFRENDCSYANNNGFECWAPRNTFVKNKANHCSYGFWMGGSDKTRLEGNEASFNGLPDGFHNSPHLPDNGHAGIVFMFGSSSHIVCRGNTCVGNAGAGIALLGDLGSQGKKWKAYHWIVEQNKLEKNRWGIYLQHADWILLAGNEYQENSVEKVFSAGNVSRFEERAEKLTSVAPLVKIAGPNSVKVGEASTWKANVIQRDKRQTDKPSRELTFNWDVGDGRIRSGPKLVHQFEKPGFHRLGVNLFDGASSELGWLDLYVVRDVQELGTESDAHNWFIEDFNDRRRSNEQKSRALFEEDSTDCLVGKSALKVVIKPYAGFRAALTYPKSRDAKWSLAGKTKLSFWLKAINEDITGWQGGPFIALHGAEDRVAYLEPKPGLDLMRTAENSEAREGWRFIEIPLRGDEQWQLDGDLPAELHAVSLGFDSWGAPTLRFWIDGLAIE